MKLGRTSGARALARSAPGASKGLCRAPAPLRCLSVRTSAAAAPTLPGGTIADDTNVPEAHKGLHNYLYAEGSEKEHDTERSYTVRKDEDEGALMMPVGSYLENRDGEKPLGVYCVYDSAGAAQYVGYSRNMVLAIKGHLARVGPEQCASVRAIVYGNKAMTSRTNLERGVVNWVQEQLGGKLPPGMADPVLKEQWEGGVAVVEDGVAVAPSLDRSVMSVAELAAYEEKRTKMRKAMGEKMVDPNKVDAPPEEETEDDMMTRRAKLMKAMDRGDWSAVIDQQTAEVVALAAAEAAAADADAQAASGAAPAAAGGTIVSPFQKQSVNAADAAAAAVRKASLTPISVEAVTAALDEVRPYLMADGGDVEVVDVTDGIVYLRLQGACTSCPSQSATMKGGIERVIRENFGEQVKDILQLDAKDPAASVEMVDRQLDMLRGAIMNLGGSVEVISVEHGVATLKYIGPPAVGKGIAGAVKDTFKELREVRLV